MVPNCRPAPFDRAWRTTPGSLFGAFLFAFRLCLGLAAFRLVATFGGFQRHALVLAARLGVFFLRRRKDLHGAAGFLDGCDCRLGCAVDREINLGLELTLAEQ